MPRGLPDFRPAHETQRRGEARIDAVERDEIVEQIVRVVGRDPPRERRPGHSRRLAPGDPDLGLQIRAVDDEREIDVEPAGAPHALAVWPGTHCADGPDVRPVEQITLEAQDGVVRVVGAACLRIEGAEFPGPEASVNPSSRDERHRRAARVEADAARVEQLYAAPRPEVELSARFEKKLALFGEEEGKSGEVDDFWSASTCAKSVLRVASTVNVGVMPSLASSPAFPFREPSARFWPIDTALVFNTLGLRGRAQGAVVQMSVVLVPGTVTLNGRAVTPALGYGTPINIQLVSPDRAVATGDFTVLAAKVAPVFDALTAHSITATALHSHLVGAEPTLYYMHFWADGPLTDVLRGLRAALDAAR